MKKSQLLGCKFAVLAMVFAATSSYAGTAWKLISSAPGRKIYIDQKSIEIDGDIRRVLQLQEFREITEAGFKSIVGPTEYDCANQKTRLLRSISYEKSMGAGKKVSEVTGLDWSDVSQLNPAFSIALKFLCSAKKKE